MKDEITLKPKEELSLCNAILEKEPRSSLCGSLNFIRRFLEEVMLKYQGHKYLSREPQWEPTIARLGGQSLMRISLAR